MTVVMVSGSRDAPMALGRVTQRLAEHLTVDDKLLCGMARGVDMVAWHFGLRLGCECVSYAPDNRRPSPQRYHERNDAMLDEAEVVVAFWDGVSRGTASVIRKALKRDLPIHVYDPRTGQPRNRWDLPGADAIRDIQQMLDLWQP